MLQDVWRTPLAPHPLADSAAILTFTAHGNFAASGTWIRVHLNDTELATGLFSGTTCAGSADVETLMLHPDTYNEHVAACGPTTITMQAVGITPLGQCHPPDVAFISVSVDYTTAGPKDHNCNGVVDDCECLADLDGDGHVAFGDIVALFAAWGPCSGCPEDLDCDGEVDSSDLQVVLASIGPCS